MGEPPRGHVSSHASSVDATDTARGIRRLQSRTDYWVVEARTQQAPRASAYTSIYLYVYPLRAVLPKDVSRVGIRDGEQVHEPHAVEVREHCEIEGERACVDGQLSAS